MVPHFGMVGNGHVFRFEFMCTDDCILEIHKIEAQVRPIGN
jgi:hypothetical protein